MNDIAFVPSQADRATRSPACARSLPPAHTAAPLRIALVVEAAGGGVAVHLTDLIAGLRARSNVEIHLIAPLGARFDDAMLAGAAAQCNTFHRLPLRRDVGAHDLRGVLALRRLLRRIRPDIVHSHSSKAGALARLCRGPWKQIYTPHAVYTLNPTLSPAKRAFYGRVERVLGNACSDAVIAVSQDEADHLHALGIARDRIRLVENGVTPPRLLAGQAARIALGLADNTFVVGFVGRFDHQKGVDRLVRIARLLDERYGKRLQVVAIGSGDFDRAAGDEARDLPANLRIAGRVDEARRYFSAFDLLALPSRYEGFPYVCLEAVAARVPMVAMQVSGATELIAEHHVGLSVPNSDDPAAFAAMVGRLVDHPAAYRLMRDQCTRAYAHFSADAMVDRTLAVYHDLLQEKA
ncbi:glycosyl transferase family 1 [Burkholderia puraquae]|uniref:D-inositol-3-phosphate glycosyltransferase n=1 Tax=Burkholderia puraquae TaxID=1904757 RepID=A0A1X1PMR0_9BURK|nr:glycosyltransferase family 4 protein [Burkholderia puraquae]ORT88243.1 glycosyl transferase family 1 [Burkholderia puraquae]CAB3750307.1 D-inositol-3-phosphate glycosyltransferase [Burkholderia puraquae]